MIDISLIQKIVAEKLESTDMFLVEIKQSPSNEIEVILDSDTSVGIDICIAVSRAVNDAFDRDQEDFELTVTSAGIGQPLKLLRQYRKLIGKEVDLVLKSGEKITATLTAAAENDIDVEYPEKVAVEGKKRKETVVRKRNFALSEIKTTREHLNFK